MDEKELLDPGLLPLFFDMGLMGIEVPTQYGGAGGTFFMSILAIEAIAKIDPAVSVVCDVQNTLVNNIFLRYANEAQRKTYLPRLASKEVGSYCS
jgi:alkylation response protein AidB-like acyl-CoA dehydrogenase